jgi:AraC family transcriptional regulator, transcriptional activator of pobA
MNTTALYAGPAAFEEKKAPAANIIFDDNNRFAIHTIGCMEAQQNITSAEPEKVHHLEILIIQKGKGSLQLDGQSYMLAENSIYCIFPGYFRKLHMAPGTTGYYISFAIEFLKLSAGYSNSAAWLEQYNNAGSAMIYKEMQPELEAIARKMKWEYSNFLEKRWELLKGLLHIFLIYFSRDLNKIPNHDAPNREKDLVNKFIGLLKKHFYTKKFVNDYASLLAVTPNYLNRTVKKITGFPTSHHIQQQIILEAKRQAIYSSESMKQIAYSLGFDNPAHFSKFFKNNCGVNFTEFKNQQQNV